MVGFAHLPGVFINRSIWALKQGDVARVSQYLTVLHQEYIRGQTLGQCVVAGARSRLKDLLSNSDYHPLIYYICV
jgi:hypothetical protein